MTEQQSVPEEKPQICHLAGVLVQHQSGFAALSNADRQFVVQKPKVAIPLMVEAVRNRNSRPKASTKKAKKRPLRILEPVQPPQITLDAPFVADNTFFNDEAMKLYRGDNFKAWFKGKREEIVSDIPLQAFRLPKAMYDNEIITDLGGEAMVETSLSDLWKKLLAQPKGESGELLTNGYANIFYIKDATGVLRAVNACWNGDSWCVLADALDDFQWFGGCQVFVRNS